MLPIRQGLLNSKNIWIKQVQCKCIRSNWSRYTYQWRNSPLRIQDRSLRPFSTTRIHQTKAQGKDQPKQDKIPLKIHFYNFATFSFYSGLVLSGLALTSLVVYYFVSDIVLPTSEARVFQRAVKIIRSDQWCLNVLGTDSKISAFGEHVVGDKWSRNRPVASDKRYDTKGREHLLMQFHVKGDKAEGLARLEMVPSDEKSSIAHYDFRYLVVEVPGHPRHYIIDNSEKARAKDPNVGFLGVKWGKN